MIIAGSCVTQLLVAVRGSRPWNLFGDPRLVRADRMPVAPSGVLIVAW
jgi:hypothetical protein